MILIIVESPAKCKKIESYLGNSYKCLASYGHIREFANGLKSIDYNNHYKSTYKISANKQKYVKILRAAIKKSSEVILSVPPAEGSTPTLFSKGRGTLLKVKLSATPISR